MNKLVIFLLLITASLHAQEFGFGFDDEESSGSPANNSFKVSVGGEVSASMVGYIDDFSEGPKHVSFGDIFSGKLNFSAKTAVAEGVINLNLEPTVTPVSIDEAYLRAFFGSLDVEAGLRKLTWGKADSFGPLDIINPLDSSQIFVEMADNNSLMGVKIARPMVHASYRFGQFSKIEGVFIPNFEPYYIASEGRWVPAEMGMLTNPTIPEDILSILPAGTNPDDIIKINIMPPPDTTTIDYAQAGLRFTTTIGSADIGAQYYYGRLSQPSTKISLTNFSFVPMSAEVDVLYLYNIYHQIGLDYAQVLFGFNVRTELAANITEDLKGDDGSIYNPSVAWSFGFDRDLFLGINLNLQVNESIRLMHDKLGSGDFMSVISGNFDIEGGSEMTATRLTARLSKTFLRDELELRTAVVWGIEDKDCLIMPALIWTKDDLCIALSAGVFTGDSEGQLGQYKDNNFIKVSLAYTF